MRLYDLPRPQLNSRKYLIPGKCLCWLQNDPMLGRSAGVLDAAALLVRLLVRSLPALSFLPCCTPNLNAGFAGCAPPTCRQFPVLVKRARPIYPTHIHLIYCVFPRSPVQPITGRVILGRENSRLSQRPRKWGPVGDLLRPFLPLPSPPQSSYGRAMGRFSTP